jgi:hypothetical protein
MARNMCAGGTENKSCKFINETFGTAIKNLCNLKYIPWNQKIKCFITFATVQCCRDLGSQGSGVKSLLGIPEGILLGNEYDIAVHIMTNNGTP